MRRIGRWLAETRLGRITFRLVAVGFAALVVYLLVWEEVGRRTGPIVQREIEKVKPIDLLRECLRTPKCRALIRVTVRRANRPERGDAQKPAPAGQRPGPGRGPGGGTTERTPGGTKEQPKPRQRRPDAASPPAQNGQPGGAPKAPPPRSKPKPVTSPPTPVPAPRPVLPAPPAPVTPGNGPIPDVQPSPELERVCGLPASVPIVC